MPVDTGQIDQLTRNLIRVLEPDLRQWLSGDQVEEDLVTAVYLRARTTIELWSTNGERTTKSDLLFVEQLALEVYFTALAWQKASPASPMLLVGLRRAIASVFQSGRPDAGRASDRGRTVPDDLGKSEENGLLEGSDGERRSMGPQGFHHGQSQQSQVRKR